MMAGLVVLLGAEMDEICFVRLSYLTLAGINVACVNCVKFGSVEK